MTRYLAVVIGLGEIGHPIYQLLSRAYGNEEVRGKDLFYPDPSQGISRAMDHDFQFMHVCFPQNPDFIAQIKDYARKFKPKYIIIHSTLSPGITGFLTSEFFGCPGSIVLYSPVRGNIRDGMLWSLEKYTKYVAAFGLEDKQIAPVIEHLEGAGFKTKYVGEPEALECAKIWDLAWYGLNIAFYQEMERRLSKSEMKITREFISSTLVESEGKVQRVLLYGGFIGGHCVIPAIEKILAEHDIPMLRAVLDSNIKRAVELTYKKPEHHPN